MTRLEAAIITAQTEVLIGDLDTLKRYAGRKLGRIVQDRDFGEPAFWELLKIESREDFRRLAARLTSREDPDFLYLVGIRNWRDAV
jgi:hypothetical protein